MTWMVAALTAAAALTPTGPVQAQATGTRVAVVNIGVVFTKYEKAKNFKTEMEKMLQPFKEQAEKIKKDLLSYQAALADPKYDEKAKEQYAQAIRVLKRRLEDLDIEARKAIGTKQENHMIQLYKEVADQIQAVSVANGIHLVLGYGEPPDPKELLTFPNINRKLTGMDMGGTVPLYFHSSLDISEHVVAALNSAYARALGNGGVVTPTGLPQQK
ncbi:MAG: OmpH family outer membrane protein [Gemmataceae bacterium]|nr:OmpH family outer membrane protein [Gemmataceae bacterium]